MISEEVRRAGLTGRSRSRASVVVRKSRRREQRQEVRYPASTISSTPSPGVAEAVTYEHGKIGETRSLEYLGGYARVVSTEWTGYSAVCLQKGEASVRLAEQAT